MSKKIYGGIMLEKSVCGETCRCHAVFYYEIKNGYITKWLCKRCGYTYYPSYKKKRNILAKKIEYKRVSIPKEKIGARRKQTIS